MKDDKKYFENNSDEEVLDLGYGDTSNIENNDFVQDANNAGYFNFNEINSSEPNFNNDIENIETIEEIQEFNVVEEIEEVAQSTEMDENSSSEYYEDIINKEDISVFSRALGGGVSTFSAYQDKRLPSGTNLKAAGTISQYGTTEGNVSLNNVSSKNTVEAGYYEFRGGARPAFLLTGSVLDARATISTVSSFNTTSVTLDTTNGSTVTDTLRNFMIKAANEKIDDINGIRTPAAGLTAPSAPGGIPNIHHRTNLLLALKEIFGANHYDNNNNHAGGPLLLTFRDLDSNSPKQAVVLFDKEEIFDITSMDYIRNIVVEESLINNTLKLPSTASSRSTSTKSNININAESIAIKFDIKDPDMDWTLKTNTNYEFTGINKSIVFFEDHKTNTATVQYLDGFMFSAFKTGKRVPLFETYCISTTTSQPDYSPLIGLETITTTITISTTSFPISAVASGFLTTCIDFNSVNSSVHLCLPKLIDDATSSTDLASPKIAAKVGGTSIRFNNFKIFDLDSTIKSIEIEDDRTSKYPGSLVSVNSDKPESGAYLQITGLQRSTPYVFRKLHVTAQPGKENITKTFLFDLDITNSGSDDRVISLKLNTQQIRTLAFSEPKLFIEADTMYYSTVNDQLSSTLNTGSNEIPVFIPKDDIELPNKVRMPVVKNGKTSLRYVIEVENPEGLIGDLTVNGLKGDEKFSVEKVVGKERVYFILYLQNLSEKRDYGFLILELSYSDLDGRNLVTRQVLSDINKIVYATASSTNSPRQFPDDTLDNTTGPELNTIDLFNVKLFNAKTLEARKAEIPVLIDDIDSRFLRLQFVSPEANPDVEIVIDNGLLIFTNLQPKSEVVYKLDFVWKDKNNNEQILSKYAKINTPPIPNVDVKIATIKPADTTARVVFELFDKPKSTIIGVSLNRDFKSTWDASKLALEIEGLRPNTEYNDIEVTFKLENGLISKYKLEKFKTTELMVPPTGPAAEFVEKIYKFALNRKPEVEGWKFWTNKLETREISVTQIIYGLMKEDEFVNRYLSPEEFIKTMYLIILGREPEQEGMEYWKRKFNEYKTEESSLLDLRIRIGREMMNENEFKEYVVSIGLRY